MYKILYPTTLNFNPGDEIIYRGVKNCVDSLIGETMPVFWNRHPSVSPGNHSYDNAFCPQRDRDFRPDYMIFAGSPSWYGSGVWELYRWLIHTKTRCSFVGIGTSTKTPKIDPYVKKVMNENADIILCRDENTKRIIQGFVEDKEKVEVLPCPSTMSYTQHKPRKNKKVIGLNYQCNDMKWQDAEADLDTSFKSLHTQLSVNYEVRVFGHFMKDMTAASRIFGENTPIYFSSKPEDLQRWFSEVDVMIGPRLHGCMGAIATGGAGILTHAVENVRRAEAAKPIPVLQVTGADSEDIMRSLDNLDIESNNKAVARFIEATYTRYNQSLSELPHWITESKKVQKSFDGRTYELGKWLHVLQRLPYLLLKRF